MVSRKMNNLSQPVVIHFLSESKPWTILSWEYQADEAIKNLPIPTLHSLGKGRNCSTVLCYCCFVMLFTLVSI